MLTRRRTLQLTAAAILTTPTVTWAQAWPTRAIHAIVPFTAGGASDIIARTVCDQLSRQLGQPIVVENRPGAGGSIGASAVAKSDPDGYTIMIHSISHTITAAMYSRLPYDANKDFSSVVSLGDMANVLMVSPDSGYKTVRDLVEAARKNPGSISFASSGVGSINQLTAERLKVAGKFDAVHVPYKGAPEALLDLMAGRVNFFFSPYLPAKPFIEDRKLIPLAVAGEKRSASLPSVPTTTEAGYPNTNYPYWNAMFVPAKTPRDIVDKLRTETIKAMDAVKDKLTQYGTEPMITTSAALDEHVRKQIAINAEVIKIAGIKIN